MHDHSAAHIPYFTLHVLEFGDIDRVVDTVDSKFHTSFRYEDISEERGTKFSWRPIGFAGIDVKILKSRHISQRSASNMSDGDKTFLESAGVWLPRRFDINNANPFRSFQLEFEESELEEPSDDEKTRAKEQRVELQRAKGPNALFITADCFKSARTAFLRDLLRKRLAENPDFCIEEADKTARLRLQKKTIWNDILLELDEDAWIASMMGMVDYLLAVEEMQDDLEIVVMPQDEVRARFEEAAREALLDFHPRMVEELAQYETMQKIVGGAKHFKIYPENEVLHYSFLHRNTDYLNDMLGKAEAVYPKANKPNQDPPIAVDYSRPEGTAVEPAGAESGNVGATES